MRYSEGRRGTALICIVVIAPFIVSATRAAVAGWMPSWDTGFVQLRVLDVGTDRTPLLGMPSTVSQGLAQEIHHPGPLQFWLLAVPFLVLRFVRPGLEIAQALVNATLAVVTVLAARSVAGTRAGWIAVAEWLAAIIVIGDEALHDPWNPQFATMALLAGAGCAVALGYRTRTWIAAALTVCASIAAQAHLVALIPAVALVVAATVIVLRRDGWHGAKHSVLVAAGAGTLAWIGPIADQLLRSPGNLWSLVQGTGATDPPFGPVAGFDRFARVLVPPGLLRSGVPTVAQGVGRVVVWLLALALLAALGVGWRRRRRAHRPTALFQVGAVLALTTWAAQAITPQAFSSVFGRHIWAMMWPAALFVWAGVGLAVLDAVRPLLARFSSLPRTGQQAVRVRVALVCALLVGTLLVTALSPLDEQRDGRWFTTIDDVAAAVPINGLPHHSIIVAGDGIAPESELLAGLAADLQRRGVSVYFADPMSAGLVHPDRFTTRSDLATVLVTITDDEYERMQLLTELRSPLGDAFPTIRVFLVPAP
jgi:hypothetical protein